MKRLFFALWPDDETRQKVVGLSLNLDQSKIKPVRPDNLHVTLVFLGNVEEADEIALIQPSTEITVNPIELQFDRISYWRRPKIICLTCSQIPDEAISLVNKLNEMVFSCGLETESRPYKPHVTLARKVQHKLEMEFEPIVWRANSFCLVESFSEPNGVFYRVLKSWKL